MPAKAEMTTLHHDRRPHGRDLAVVVAVGGAVWLAVNIAQSRLPHYAGVDVVPTENSVDTGAFVAPSDRGELASLPRERPETPKEHSGSAPGGGHSHGSRSDGSGGSGGSGGKDEDPPPPPDTSEPPLVEASLPVVGTVTVEEPEVPEVPDVEEVVPETPTLPLP